LLKFDVKPRFVPLLAVFRKLASGWVEQMRGPAYRDGEGDSPICSADSSKIGTVPGGFRIARSSPYMGEEALGAAAGND